jgi:hypothetical protein
LDVCAFALERWGFAAGRAAAGFAACWRWAADCAFDWLAAAWLDAKAKPRAKKAVVTSLLVFISDQSPQLDVTLLRSE